MKLEQQRRFCNEKRDQFVEGFTQGVASIKSGGPVYLKQKSYSSRRLYKTKR